MNRTLSPKGLRLIPLRRNEKQAMLYPYRPERLREDLSSPEALEILRREADMRQERCLHELMRRLQRFEALPHEIGLFLSYPPEDVRGLRWPTDKVGRIIRCSKIIRPARTIPVTRSVAFCTCPHRLEILHKRRKGKSGSFFSETVRQMGSCRSPRFLLDFSKQEKPEGEPDAGKLHVLWGLTP